MRYFALAVDYDETLALHGKVPASTERALERLKATGRQFVLVTGRTLPSLASAWPSWELCDVVIAENGGVLAVPRSHEVRPLAPAPSESLRRQLESKKIDFSLGEVVVALASADAPVALTALRETGLDAHIVFNGESAMMLPAGVSKGSGLAAALARLQLSHHEVVGVGNEANDRVFLERCECAVAVANATAVIKESCDFVTKGAASAGVEEVIAELVEEDLGRRTMQLRRSTVPLGRVGSDHVLSIPAYGLNLLIAGASGSGKSTFATGLAERLIERTYQVLILDPEGDYTTLPSFVSLGDRRRPPSVQELLNVLENPHLNVAANLLGIPFYDRPKFLADLLPSLQAMRVRTGRPHWIFVDEAHHFLPQTWRLAALTMPLALGEVVMITVRPQDVAPEALDMMTLAVAVGPEPLVPLRELAAHAGKALDERDVPATDPGREALFWDVRRESTPRALGIIKGRVERFRHHRKYAEGDLGDHSFYFRGPRGAMNLRIQNLMLFVQIAQGIDDETWLHHLRRHDYSRWLRTAVKDPDLAEQVAQVEARADLTSQQSRLLVCNLLTRKYSL